mgnify:CR=1 FL=1
MSRTASMVMKIIGASLAFAAVICLSFFYVWTANGQLVTGPTGRFGKKLEEFIKVMGRFCTQQRFQL